jgi:hypothetical protein
MRHHTDPWSALSLLLALLLPWAAAATSSAPLTTTTPSMTTTPTTPRATTTPLSGGHLDATTIGHIAAWINAGAVDEPVLD